MVEKTLMGSSYWIPFKSEEDKPVSNSNEEEKKQAPVKQEQTPVPTQTPAPKQTPAPESVPSEWTEVQGHDIAGEGDVA